MFVTVIQNRLIQYPMGVQYRGEEQFRESLDSVHLSTDVSEKGNLED